MAGPVPGIGRRRVLGAAAALPFLALAGQLPAIVAGPSPSSRRLWDRRLARYRADRGRGSGSGGDGVVPGGERALRAGDGRDRGAVRGRER